MGYSLFRLWWAIMSRLDQRNQRGLASWTTCNLLRFSSTFFGCDPRSAQLREKMAKCSSSVLSTRSILILWVEVFVRFPNTDTLLDCESNSYLRCFWRSDIKSMLHYTLGSEHEVHWIRSRTSEALHLVTFTRSSYIQSLGNQNSRESKE